MQLARAPAQFQHVLDEPAARRRPHLRRFRRRRAACARC